jgi:DNA polymerase-3 subunit alpha (Gram-positive type)
VLRKLRELCGAEVEIAIEAGADLQGKALFDAMEKIRAEMIAKGPKPAFVDKKPASSGGGATPQQQGDTFYGKPFKGNPVPMKDLSLDMGFVIVEGRVFAVEHKELKKRNAWVINFDMTDNTNSVRVSKFMEANEAKPVLDNVSVGSVLRVQGKMDVNKFDNETILRPYGIAQGSMPKRKDTAEGLKRVELHLHTTMSNMDALTPTGAAVKQAASWGHRAIGITDHGVTQSFPDAMKAAGKAKVAGTEQNIKILYGMEGYYVNDVDDRIVVHGSTEAGFDDEFVAFDLETTGLSSLTDTIIEIGAVVFKQGKEIDRFQTFVDPGRKLEKKIIDLTGITDAMLVGAPKIEEVLPKFLEFVGGRPLVAHNADFDVGFVREAAKRLNLPFDPTSVDTLILSQNLLSHLNKFKLNIVADALSLPEFNHHRAADDSMTCGLIFDRLMPKLLELGVDSIQKINAAMPALRSKGKVNDRQARHIILYAKNQQGLRNLYHLISLGNLEYFKRVPRIPKSELLRYREGLIIG